MFNVLNQTDFYKVNHFYQYPQGTNLVFSNFTPRSSGHFGREVDGVIFAGLQRFILNHLFDDYETFFSAPSAEEATEFYKQRITSSLGPDAITFDHVEALWELGYLPLRIRALDEGTLVPLKVPMFTIENTHPDFFWVTNYIETVLSAEIWKPCTTATIAREYRKILEKYSDITGAPKEMIPFSVHDFSMRGMSGREDAANAGLGHLLSFVGSDNIPAIDSAGIYYKGDDEGNLIGTSIPASEHSVMCAGGKEDEYETYKRFITELYPNGLVGIVSDTWDLWKVLTEIAPSLKDEIMSRDGKVVFRPDSGDPADIICGIQIQSITELGLTLDHWKCRVADIMDLQFRANLDPEAPHFSETEYWEDCTGKTYIVTYEPDLNRYDKQYYYVDNCGDDVSKCAFKEISLSNEEKGAVQILWEHFGGTINEKGFKELDTHVGLIYGDSITMERCEDICERLKDKGFSSGNVVFGVGSYTYQMITRDTFGMAMKATYCEINGEGREIFKDPVTDDGIKKSAKGLLMVVKDGDSLKLVDQVTWDDVNSEANQLKIVFEDSVATKTHKLSEVRARVENSF